jgi:hypothetical protein
MGRGEGPGGGRGGSVLPGYIEVCAGMNRYVHCDVIDGIHKSDFTYLLRVLE